MNKKASLPLIFLIALFLFGCKLFIPEKATPWPPELMPSPTVELIASPSPEIPAEATAALESPTEEEPAAEPTATLVAPVLPMPEGTPAKEWKGVPVMPGAAAGMDEGDTYVFSTPSSADEVHAYYEKELQKLGWTAFALGEGDTQNTLLLFQKDAEMMTIAIIDPGDGKGLLQVVILK